MSDTEVSTVGDGVVRISWDATTTIDAVRLTVASAFDEGAHRVEAYVDPGDVTAQRAATFSGLRKEGVSRGIDGREDRIVYARLASDVPADQPEGFRALLNSFLPRKRAISQLLVRDPDDRVLLCNLTYKRDWDLPGGVVEVGESPQVAVAREVEEELALAISGRSAAAHRLAAALERLGRRPLPGLRRRRARILDRRPDRPPGARDPLRGVLHP